MREDKAEILQALVSTLNLTRMGSTDNAEEQITMSYHTDEVLYSEAVKIFVGDTLVGVANVSCDSGVAMMRDILKANYFN